MNAWMTSPERQATKVLILSMKQPVDLAAAISPTEVERLVRRSFVTREAQDEYLRLSHD